MKIEMTERDYEEYGELFKRILDPEREKVVVKLYHGLQEKGHILSLLRYYIHDEKVLATIYDKLWFVVPENKPEALWNPQKLVVNK